MTRYGYHIAPQQGWSNDPNGLCYFQGRYHVFFQNNPLETNTKTIGWAHVSSVDLIHWKREPMALMPDQDYDQDGCFSGSAIQVGEALYLLYTGHKNLAQDYAETQCLAVSQDAVTFEKFENNPIITTPPTGNTHRFRDPKVWQEQEKFYAVIGGESRENLGQVNLYQSDSITGPWEYVRQVAQAQTGQGTMWECPDYFTLDGKRVLLISPKGLDTTYKGGFDTTYFLSDEPACFEEMQVLDAGTDFYAAATFFDPIKQRRLVWGWFGLPGEQEKESQQQVGALTLPRELRIKEGSLWMQPIAELCELREQQQNLANGLVIAETTEIIFQSKNLSAFTLKLSTEQASYQISCAHQQLTLEIKDALRDRIDKVSLDMLEEVRLFLDRGLTELFINNGQLTFTNKCELRGPIMIETNGITNGKVYLLASDEKIWQ
ncbi:glycoside hydrolase family 32 protein [Candidatus Enterococcus ferrettii]|uniref:Sucrose-6-phosphate hydrolase n=1 Tax=Candidatus Enterococcus ferrettii TaxID=2815324 RepID=A0ABV0EPG4_9ENTE|nr:sucrose-6-phosphate hydrolase [Enterococcus sp. 665A]MBO1339696.1 sucrose-6-phosphate hydrolase [Enterococcus sp. 665A]